MSAFFTVLHTLLILKRNPISLFFMLAEAILKFNKNSGIFHEWQTGFKLALTFYSSKTGEQIKGGHPHLVTLQLSSVTTSMVKNSNASLFLY